MKSLTIFLAAAICVATVASATEHKVGGDGSWDLPNSNTFYQQWADQTNFSVGDTISFTYTSLHTVAEVTKSEFDSCSYSGTPATSGSTVITLSKSGNHYFICTTEGHCGSGMKFSVNVLASASPSSSSTNATASPPPSSPRTTTSSAAPAASPASNTPSQTSSLAPAAPTTAPSSASPPTESSATSPTTPNSPSASSPAASAGADVGPPLALIAGLVGILVGAVLG